MEVAKCNKKDEQSEKIGNIYSINFAPLDSEGYVQSFSLNEKEEYSKFFNKYGFVIVRDVISDECAKQSIEDIWEIVELQKCFDEEDGHVRNIVSRDDISTWEYWPGLRDLGLLSQALSFQSWKNRVNPNLLEAFKTVIGKDNLWVSVDNWGALRPTKNISTCPLVPNKTRTIASNLSESESKIEIKEYTEQEKTESGETKFIDKPKWKTNSRWLHWDLNPFAWLGNKKIGLDYEFDDFISENNGSKNDGVVKVQGFVNLIDCFEDDGGFCLVPGFQHHLKDWISQPHLEPFMKENEDDLDFVSVPLNDPMQTQIQKIPMRAKSLVIWSSEMPHCNYSNNSNKFRMVQYIKMFESKNGFKGTNDRRRMLKQAIPIEIYSNSKSAQQLLGLIDYDDEIKI